MKSIHISCWIFFGLAMVSGQEMALKDLIRKKVSSHQKDGHLAGAVTLVARDGEVIDLQAHGVRNLESGDPVRPDSIFKIHSFTKSITSAAALMLFEEGHYQFEDPVSNYLPEFSNLKVKSRGQKAARPAENVLRVSHLFTHTSGMTYEHRDVLKSKSLDELSRRLAAKPLAFEPGEGWAYGMSIDVLGRLIEAWSGQPYATFLRDRILDPLEMKDTAFFVPEQKSDRLMTIYKSSNKDSNDFVPDKENASVPSTRPGFCMPGGGLYSTASDYHAFLRMILNGGSIEGKTFLKPETVKLMTTNQVPESVGWIRFGKEIRDGFGYGYGFNVVTRRSQFDPASKVGECGWGGKASCHYWFDPETKVAVITLEQLVPYRWSLERLLKAPVYEFFGTK